MSQATDTFHLRHGLRAVYVKRPVCSRHDYPANPTGRCPVCIAEHANQQTQENTP